MSDRLLCIGVIVQPHGIHGELRAHLFNPQSGSLGQAKQIWLGNPHTSTVTAHDLLAVREQPKGVLLTLAGCDTRNQAESLRKFEIYIAKDQLPPLAESEFYFYQLEGLPVYSTTGEALGHVVRVMPGAAQDILVLAYQQREILIPITNALVPTIDLKARRIEIHLLPGLLDE